MAELINAMQQEIRRLWVELGIPAAPVTSLLESAEDSKRRENANHFPSFATYMEADVSADTHVLERLEQEKDALDQRLARVKPILKKIEQRQQLIEDRMELEELKKDPQRLLGRQGMKQRKKEEEMEKRIRQKLPTLTERLIQDLREWQQDNDGEAFMYEGRPYLETIEESDRSFRQYRAQQARTRAQRRQQDRENTRRTSQVGTIRTAGRPLQAAHMCELFTGLRRRGL
eukprot:scaffold2862_cov272-Pinguiococcus_pyrenoidosus.AAC.10